MNDFDAENFTKITANVKNIKGILHQKFFYYIYFGLNKSGIFGCNLNKGQG